MIKMIKLILPLSLFIVGIMALVNVKNIIFVNVIWILYSMYIIYEEMKKKTQNLLAILLYSCVLIVSILVFVKMLI